MSGSDTGLDYRTTVQTPRTEFPQRGSLPTREPERLERWERMGLTGRIDEKRRDAPVFVLHDGPPYANGDIHIGHALNKVLKDIVVRYKTMSGRRATYVPGWDCHGLPIEQKVVDELLKKDDGSKSPLEIRQLCKEYASRWVDVQREQFKRLGVGGKWDEPYITMDPDYEVAILEAFAELVGKGLVHKGFKPVHWDPVFETALAEAEIEYNDQHVSHSIYLRFPLVEEGLPSELDGLPKPTIVIWTTTPWTIPANLGVTVHADYDYVAYEVNGETLIIAKDLLEDFRKETGLSGGEVRAAFKGVILDRKECRHPVFPDKTSLLMLGEHVTLEQGTGCVHTAPAHGVEDFEIAQHYDLGVFNPVDEKGCFNGLYPEMEGVSVFDANKRLIEKFEREGSLVHSGTLTHSYPYSWRSRQPVIMRATEQWFMDVGREELRQKALNEVNRVEWIPRWGRERIYNMVESRPDWCLSRQRYWGVPIPSVLDTVEGTSVLRREAVEKFAAFVEKEGTDCWYTRPVEDFLPDEMKSQEGRYEKEYNILDVWFDSGSSHLGVLEKRDDLSWPADLYLEGSDQHRGWFQASLWVSLGVKGKAPYRAVLTHGFVLDDKGRPMSKSLGNVVSPLDVVKEMGADVLRLWVASEEYRSDLAASKGIMTQVSGVYRRIRNTIRFLLGNISDFDPAANAVPYDDLEEEDRWVLAKTEDLRRRVKQAYEEYQFHRVYHLLNSFCVTELGAVFLDCAKDRLYCSAPNDRERRSGQTALYEIATRVLRMLAPVLPFTADEAWDHLPGRKEDSVHLADFPGAEAEWENPELLEKWERLLALRSEVQRAIEPLRAKESKVIGNSLEAVVTLRSADEKTLEFLRRESGGLARLFIVSKVHLVEGNPESVVEALVPWGFRLDVSVSRADGSKCERCWVYTPEVGEDALHPTLCPRCADAVRRMTT